MNTRLFCTIILLAGFALFPLNEVQALDSSQTNSVRDSSVTLTVINFDDVSVPCGLNQTTALREQYASLGVHFLGPGNDGGGVVNECGNMGISGYSAPNFLGFNIGANYLDGGIPQPPQFIHFDSPVDHVEIKAGGSSGGRVSLTAYDSSSNPLKKVEMNLTPAMKLLSLDVKGISFVVIDSGAYAFALDDFGWSIRARE